MIRINCLREIKINYDFLNNLVSSKISSNISSQKEQKVEKYLGHQD